MSPYTHTQIVNHKEELQQLREEGELLIYFRLTYKQNR